MDLSSAKPESDEAHQKMKNLDQTPNQNRNDFVKLYKAYKDYIEKKQHSLATVGHFLSQHEHLWRLRD